MSINSYIYFVELIQSLYVAWWLIVFAALIHFVHALYEEKDIVIVKSTYFILFMLALKCIFPSMNAALAMLTNEALLSLDSQTIAKALEHLK